MRAASLPALLACLVAGTLLASCSLDYRPVQGDEDLLEETPEAIMLDFRHTVVAGGKVVRILEAERAEIFDRRKETRLEKVFWVEYGEDGTVQTEARADRAVWKSGLEEGMISGNITIHSLPEEAWITAEVLNWKGREKLLTSAADARVEVRKANGSRVEGRGFRADFRRKRIEFTRRVQGTYVSAETE